MKSAPECDMWGFGTGGGLCMALSFESAHHQITEREAQPGGKAAKGSPRQLQRRARSPVWWWVPRARASPRASLARAEARVG
ncbi:unnamed protein product [Prunus armeniaca]